MFQLIVELTNVDLNFNTQICSRKRAEFCIESFPISDVLIALVKLETKIKNHCQNILQYLTELCYRSRFSHFLLRLFSFDCYFISDHSRLRINLFFVLKRLDLFKRFGYTDLF